MKMAIRNIVSGAILILLAIGYAWQITLVPSRDVMPNTPGPAFFPWVILACLALLSIALFIQGIRGLKSQDKAGSAKSSADNTEGQWQKPLMMILAFAAYLLALFKLGFVIPSVIFFGVLMWLYGSRKLPFIALFSLSVPIALFVVFSYGFQVLLPRGPWGF